MYRILEDVGRGGFAVVYLARDLRSNGIVAVKVLHEHLTHDPTLVRWFDREAKLARRLSEPHVVRVLDAGVDARKHFLVMEYVQGHTLDDLLRQQGPLPPKQAVDLGCQVLIALEAAHREGIVHRDIK